MICAIALLVSTHLLRQFVSIVLTSISHLSDVIDIVKDQLYGADYSKDEDPTLFVSQKTNRGPLCDGWIAEYWDEVRERSQPTPRNMALMCAYKLCRVEFRYWGMQTKLEKFIHDTALRKTMVRAHRQAWAWQDEWHGLTMEDIRELELQTQLALQKKMGDGTDDDEEDGKSIKTITFVCHLYVAKFELCFSNFPLVASVAEANKQHSSQFQSIEKTEETPMFPKRLHELPQLKEHPASIDSSDGEDEVGIVIPIRTKTKERSASGQLSQHSKFGSRGALHSPAGSMHSFDLQVVTSNRIDLHTNYFDRLIYERIQIITFLRLVRVQILIHLLRMFAKIKLAKKEIKFERERSESCRLWSFWFCALFLVDLFLKFI